MKFEDDDLKDGKLWAALQKEIDRDLAEKESGETFQEELADIEDSIEFESKETKSEDHIPDETANLSNLRSVLEATERAKDEEAKQKMKQTKVEPVTQDIEIPEFTEEEEEIEETPAETKTESEPEEVMVDDDLIINDPFADEDDLLGEEKTETKGSEKEVLGDQVEAAMERLVSDTVGHIPMPEIDDEDDDYDDYEDDDEEYIPHGAKPQKKKGKGGAVIAVAAVAVIAVGGFFYGSKMFHYQNYFFNGTTINGVDCSDMTAKEAETKIKEQAANYTLNVKFKDNDTKSVSGKDIDYTYAGDGSVESVLKKQNSFLWFLGNGGKEKDSQVTMQYSQEKLENNGYEVIVAYDGNEALEKFIACKPDLIVLDVDMPGKDGLEVLQFIRLQDSQTPVIIYSCLIDEEKQIKGLEWGANVYLLKNYSPTLLLAQIQRCIARSGEEVIRLSKQVEYDFSACNLRVSDVVYHLTMLENKIFSILCKNRNTLVAREDLLKAGWNSQAPNCSLQLNKMVSRLRKLLKGDHSVYILTEKPLGYWLKIEQ